MSVIIKSTNPKAELKFDITPEQTVELIAKALEMQMVKAPQEEEELPEETEPEAAETTEPEPEDVQEEPSTTPDIPERHRRVESLFPDYYDHSDGYNCFLLVKCERCGTKKAFFPRHKIRYYDCACGGRTQLRDLKPLYLRCKCGKEYKYKTNVDEQEFTMRCLSCGRSVKIRLNRAQTAYVTA